MFKNIYTSSKKSLFFRMWQLILKHLDVNFVRIQLPLLRFTIMT